MAARACRLLRCPVHAARLYPSAQWRQQLRAIAWRQKVWAAGFRDLELLNCPRFVRTRAYGVVLLYGEPALMVAAGDAQELLCRLERHQRTVNLQWVCRQSDELEIIASLRRDLCRLIELNAIPLPRLVFTAATPENDDGRANQARPSRSPQSFNQSWPPASSRRMTPCDRL